MLTKRVAILIAGVVVGLIALARAGDVLVDWLWFSSLGYVGVFSTIFTTRAVLFFAVFVLSTAIIGLSGALALRYASGTPCPSPPAGPQPSLGLLLAWIELSNWDTVLRFLYQVPYGESEPVFGHDIGFYLFSLPAYIALKTWLLGLLVLSAALAGAVYWGHGDIEFDKPRRFSRAALVHGSALLGLWFVLKAWSYYLDRFLLLYSDNGMVV